MTAPSHAVPDALDSRPIAPAALAATRPFYWSVRRELWENRYIYIAPLAVAGVFLFGFIISLIGLPRRMRSVAALDPERQREAIAAPYELVAAVIMGTAIIVLLFYCLDALYGERRDRSILFWKSLPVSDMTAVLAKASIPLGILQLIAFGVTLATHVIMLLLSTMVLLGSGMSAAMLWKQLPFRVVPGLLYHLLTAHGLWAAPIYAWLLLVSAWARRAPLLWALLPPFAFCALEKIAFNTTHVAAMLGGRLIGASLATGMPAGKSGIDVLMHFEIVKFLENPGLWTGLAVTVAFLVAAARLRRYRGPI